MNGLNPFYKVLGSLTATLPASSRRYRLAAHMLGHMAVQERQKRMLDREGIRTELARETVARIMAHRKEKGGQCHHSWWKNITRLIDKQNDLHQLQGWGDYHRKSQ